MEVNETDESMDLQAAMKLADRVEEIAEKLQSFADIYAADMAELTKIWTGENANAYLKKMQQLQEQIQNSSAKLKDDADAVRVQTKKIFQ
ncbi:MAG: hypothetical protein Q4B22_07150 [Eubacteriales bacterium]|nr:hypothetical protein [Eubacteriales bacterium]